MQICTRCNSNSPDEATTCSNCGANLREWSVAAVALKDMQANPRVSAIRILVQDDCCPTCQKVMATYPKSEVPTLPVEGCSHENGCCCFYAPVLDVLFP